MEPRTFVPLLAFVFSTASLGTVNAGPTDGAWIDPALLPFVPTPTVVHAFAPTDPGNTCSGTGSYSTGPRPDYVQDLSLRVEVAGCILQSVTISWTIDGVTYSGVVDAATGAVSHIRDVSQDPGGYVGSTSIPMSGTDYGGGGSGFPSPCGSNMRTSHTSLHMWTSTGDERMTTNFNWRYAEVCQQTTYWNFWCDTAGSWVWDSCTGSSVNGHEADADGHFHSASWPNDYHAWATRDTVQIDETTTGDCTASGDMPWIYGHTCDNGPGNV